MTPRTDLLFRLADLLGDALRIVEVGSGWPSLVSVGDRDQIPVALHLGQIGLSHRSRDDLERRFQNPASRVPVQQVPGYFSMLLGAWESDPYIHVDETILVLADAERRIDHQTRVSVFVSVTALEQAQRTGWATHTSDSGEGMFYFRPEMLPVAAALSIAGVEPKSAAIAAAIDEMDQYDDGQSRTRRAVSALVRDAKFRGDVLKAYGSTCAMCGLGLSLVEGAHIYPASAPGSVDTVRNGIALCANHHRAFDRHQVTVLPDDLRVVFRPDVLGRASGGRPERQFLGGTFDFLASPRHAIYAPDPRFIVARHQHYAAEYEWILG